MKKHIFYTELSYIVGLIILALGTAFMEAANFGLSMVVAPAYLIYCMLSQYLTFFTFGMAEYTFQAVLLVLLVIVMRKFKISYLFSFVTAVLYGIVLDFSMIAVSIIPCGSIQVRTILYIAGLLCCSAGVSLLFHTYISPEAYELFVREVSAKFNVNIHKFKTGYDCVSCCVSIIMSFAIFGVGNFEGVKWGTILCALINGWLIGKCTGLFEKYFTFTDRFDLRRYFEK